MWWGWWRKAESSGVRKQRRGNVAKGGRKKRTTPSDGERHEIDLDPLTPRMREDEEKAARRKGFRMALSLVVAMVLGALVYTAVKEAVFTNPAFELKHVFVKTSGMLTPTDIARATGLRTGDNLMTADLSDVKSNIQSLPAVESATVRRDFSGRLDIEVKQRPIVAWVKCVNLGWEPQKPGAGLLVSSGGHAVPCVNMLDEYSHLPELVDESLNQVEAGQQVKSDRFQEALKLVVGLQERNKQLGGKLLSVTVKNECELVAHVKDGPAFSFAWDDVAAGLKRLDLILSEAVKQKWLLAEVNLMAESAVPVKFRVQPKIEGGAPAAMPITQPGRRTTSAGNVSTNSTSRRRSTR
jgi:cell division protein FtsQ